MRNMREYVIYFIYFIDPVFNKNHNHYYYKVLFKECSNK